MLRTQKETKKKTTKKAQLRSGLFHLGKKIDMRELKPRAFTKLTLEQKISA